jgi:hypothetical protein
VGRAEGQRSNASSAPVKEEEEEMAGPPRAMEKDLTRRKTIPITEKKSLLD